MFGFTRDRDLLVRLERLMALSANHHTEIVSAHQQLLAAREQLAALRASFEWLTTHVNRLEEERTQLLARVLGVSFPAMEIDRRPPAPTPASSVQAAILGVPLADRYENTVPGTQVATSMFEDPGEAVAAEFGITHDPVGNVQYTR